MGTKVNNGFNHAPRDLKTWRTLMGYSIIDAAMQLGVEEALFEHWEKTGSTPPYIALACAALALGIKP